MTELDLNAALDRLAARLCREIRSPRKRNRAISEYRGHLEDEIEELLRQGRLPEEAYAELESSLGDTDKISTLLASVHNTHHVPLWLPWLGGIGIFAGLFYLYLTTENDILKAWLGVGLQVTVIAAAVSLSLVAATWIRALHKRASAIRRLKRYARENGGEVVFRQNGYRSLFVRLSAPEITVDMGDRRYLLYLWATVRRRRTLHLQDNGIYSYDKHFGYMLASPGIAPHSRVWLFRPKGMENDPLFTHYHSEMVKLPQGAHLMPDIRFDACMAPDRINIPIFLLNPIPLDVEICENGHIHPVREGDTLPASLGGARLLSMSGLISLMEEIRVFGKEGGRGTRYE